MKRQLKLENNCYVDYFLNMGDVKEAIEKNTTLTGKVMYIDELNKNIIVRLGGEVLGIMPWTEATMYPLTNKYRHCTNKLWELRPDQISALDGRRVRVKVKDITPQGPILSRKDNMLEAWEQIKKIPDNTVVPAAINGIHRANTGVFFDIGEGITTFCIFKEYTATRGVLSEWVRFGEMSNIRIFGASDENLRIDCSRKMACSQKRGYQSFRKYSIIDVKVASPAFNKTGFCGYHVEVNPIVTGIADAPYVPRNIQLGETVQAVIRKVMANERKMSLIIL